MNIIEFEKHTISLANSSFLNIRKDRIHECQVVFDFNEYLISLHHVFYRVP